MLPIVVSLLIFLLSILLINCILLEYLSISWLPPVLDYELLEGRDRCYSPLFTIWTSEDVLAKPCYVQ